MSVIIDDFEVVVQGPPGEAPEQAAAAPRQPQTLKPDDVCTVVRQRAERAARLHAH